MSVEVRRTLVRSTAVKAPDRYAGTLADSPYFSTYESWPTPWRMAVGEVDGAPAVIIEVRDAERWAPMSLVDIGIEHDRITRIDDYYLCPWMMENG